MDRESFDRLVLGEISSGQRFAIRLSGSVEQAEEIVQNALLRAHVGWRGFKGKSSVRTWFFQIIVHAFRDDLKDRERRKMQAIDPQLRDSNEKDPAVMAEAAELGRAVAVAVSSLPPRQREVIVLHTYEQMNDVEIAQILKLNPQNVRTNLHLARQRLKDLLAAYLKEDYAPDRIT